MSTSKSIQRFGSGYVHHVYATVKCFCRAMHYSAKCGLAIACRLYVRLSVTLVDCDHTGWNSSEIILRLVSVGRSLSADPIIMDLFQGEQPEILAQSDPSTVDLSVGDFDRKLWPNGLQIAQRSQWRTYRKSPSLFRMVPSLTPYDLPFPKMGFHMPQRNANGHISATGDPIHFMFGSRVGFSGSADRMALFPVTSNPCWRQAAMLDNFEWPYLRNSSFDPLI